MTSSSARLPLLILTMAAAACGPSETEIRSIVAKALHERTSIAHITAGETIGPYSPAVTAGNFVFLSGQIGIDPVTRTLAGDDIVSQTDQALRNVSSLLQQAGLDSSDVVQCTVYLTDIGDFQQMNLRYGGFFGEGSYPARTTVAVAALPAGARVEIAAIAYKQ